MTYPEHLAHLSSLFVKKDISYFMSAPWLTSDFDSPVWTYNFAFKNDQKLDWGVRLYDGSLLTDEQNAELIKIFRCWLIGSTLSANNNTHNTTMTAQSADFRRTITIIDQILQQGSDLQLVTTGLSLISADHMRDVLDQIGTSSTIALSTYDWNTRLREFCIDLVENTDPALISRTLQDHPYLSEISPFQIETNELDLPLESVPSIRAALFLNNYYNGIPTGGYNISSVLVSAKLYANTLGGKARQKPQHPILGYVTRTDKFLREYNNVPVTNPQRGGMAQRDLVLYKSSFLSLKKLLPLELRLPSSEAFKELSLHAITGPEMGRFKNVPTRVIFRAIRDSIEMHFEYGPLLLKSFCNIAQYVMANNLSILRIPDAKIVSLLEPKIAKLGVKTLGLSARSIGRAPGAALKVSKESYFSRLRKCEGLLEMIGIYYAAVQIVVGGTMAKRGVELRSLDPRTCLSKDLKWLIASLAKSTRGRRGLRSTNARPIDPLAVEMLQMLIEFQNFLLKIGYIDKTYPVFSSPGIHGTTNLISCDIYLYYKNIDLFCDFFEVELDKYNRRWYPRQHQLRRFFALVFLNCGHGASIDILQWVFGHTDPSHIWNYISEELPGKELRNTLAQTVSEQMASKGSTHYSDLIELINDTFGTKNVPIMDSEELTGYLEFLMDGGQLSLEPVFLEDDTGFKVEILAIVRTR